MTILQHYGVKGMRWGVRRKNRGGRRESADAKTLRSYKKRGTKDLSNDELKRALQRIDMESRFNKATASKLSKAKQAIASHLGKQILNAGPKLAIKAVRAYIENQLDVDLGKEKKK